MWNGTGDSEARTDICACVCPVHSAAKSAQDSVRNFAVSGLAARFPATTQKTDGYSETLNTNVFSFLSLLVLFFFSNKLWTGCASRNSPWTSGSVLFSALRNL